MKKSIGKKPPELKATYLSAENRTKKSEPYKNSLATLNVTQLNAASYLHGAITVTTFLSNHALFTIFDHFVPKNIYRKKVFFPIAIPLIIARVISAGMLRWQNFQDIYTNLWNAVSKSPRGTALYTTLRDFSWVPVFGKICDQNPSLSFRLS